MAHECLEKRGLTDKRPIIADRTAPTGRRPLVWCVARRCWLTCSAPGLLGMLADPATAPPKRFGISWALSVCFNNNNGLVKTPPPSGLSWQRTGNRASLFEAPGQQ
jgi:hypothetical protein